MNLHFESNILAFTFLMYLSLSLCCTFLKKISDYASCSKKPSHLFRRLTGQIFLCVGIVDGVQIFHPVTIPISLVFGIFISVSATKVKYKFDSRRIQKFQNIVHLVSKWPKILRQHKAAIFDD